MVINFNRLFCFCSCIISINWLRKKYNEPRDAKAFSSLPCRHFSNRLLAEDSSTQTATTSRVDAVVQTSSPDLHYISNLFSQYCNETGILVPDDYLELSVSAMNQTRSGGHKVKRPVQFGPRVGYREVRWI